MGSTGIDTITRVHSNLCRKTLPAINESIGIFDEQVRGHIGWYGQHGMVVCGTNRKEKLLQPQDGKIGLFLQLLLVFGAVHICGLHRAWHLAENEKNSFFWERCISGQDYFIPKVRFFSIMQDRNLKFFWELHDVSKKGSLIWDILSIHDAFAFTYCSHVVISTRKYEK